MNIFCIGSRVTAEAAGRLREQLVTTAQLFPQLDIDTLRCVELDGSAFVGSVHTPTSALGSRRYVAYDDDFITLYDGTIVDSLGELPFQDAEVLGRHWAELPERLEGQFAVARVSRAEPNIELFVDFLGMRQVYHAQFDGAHIFSNSADLLARVGDRSAHDDLGLSSFLTWGWAGADRTLVEGVRAVAGGQLWSVRAGASEPTIRTYYPPRKLATIQREPLTPQKIRDLATSLRTLVSTLASNAEDLTCGLTAGIQ